VFKGADKQVRLQTLCDELESLESMKMMESENVFDYITRVQTMVNQLNQNGETLTDTQVVENILRTLTENFENIVCVVEESKDLATLTINELVVSHKAHEQRKKKKEEETLEQALQTKTLIKDEKVLFYQNRSRRHCRGSCGNGRDSQGSNYEGYHREKEELSQPNWHGRGHDRGRGGRSNYFNIECYKFHK